MRITVFKFCLSLVTIFSLSGCPGGTSSVPTSSPDTSTANPNSTPTPVQLSEIAESVAIKVGRKVLFTGGEDRTSNGLVDIYNLDTQSWSSSRLSGQRNSMAAVVIENSAYFIGGVSNAQPSDQIDIYDSTQDRWESNSLTVARSGPGVVSIGSKLVVGGGYNQNTGTNTGHGTNSLESIEVINTNTDARQSFSLSVPRANLAAVAIGNNAYFIGGYPCFYAYDSACDGSDSIDVLNTASNSQSTITMPHRRARHQARVIGNMILIAGGESQAGTANTIDIFNTTNSQWTSVSVTPSGAGSSATVVGTYFVLAGGAANPFSIIIYDSLTGNVRTSTLNTRRYNCATVTHESAAVFAGGQNTIVGGLSDIELVDPTTGLVSIWMR